MKKKIIFIIIAILVLIRAIVGIVNIYNNEHGNDIIKYELKTHEYYNQSENKKYCIDSISELNSFYSIYSNKLDIDVNYLDNNSIFIETMEVSSGSISVVLDEVNLDNNKVNFVISKNTPEVGTNDMVFWYLVAIIPNSKLKNIDTSEWITPSKDNNEVDK